jgi:hypothetical protein
MDNSECLSVKSVKIYPEMTSQYYFFLNMVLVDYIVVFLYRGIYSDKPLSKYCLIVCLIVFKPTFNNSSVISWRSDLLVEETGVPGENH